MSLFFSRREPAQLRPIHLCFAAFIVSVATAVASDNSKQIEAILKNHGESVAKADEARARVVDKSRHEAVLQLVELASRGYAEKDRVAETNAWKAVLTVDRAHAKATQYFKDLGTLEKILAELPKESPAIAVQPAAVLGKWLVYRDNNATTPFIEYDFRADGTLLRCRGNDWKPLGTYGIEGQSLIARDTDGLVSRFAVIGDKLIQEQWAAGYPKEMPTWFYFASRAK